MEKNNQIKIIKDIKRINLIMIIRKSFKKNQKIKINFIHKNLKRITDIIKKEENKNNIMMNKIKIKIILKINKIIILMRQNLKTIKIKIMIILKKMLILINKFIKIEIDKKMMMFHKTITNNKKNPSFKKSKEIKIKISIKKIIMILD